MAVLTFPAHAGGAETVIDTSLRFASVAEELFSAGYRAAPALMLGVVLATVLPLLAMLMKVSEPLRRSPDATLRYRPGRNEKFEAEVANILGSRNRLPFVEIESTGRKMRCAILRDMLRIGREHDNDIRIPSRSVHRYHAAIHRDLDDWHITDLTGVESNGLIVNGRRCCEARLNDGDVIELGPGKLRFRAGFG
ncbi:FHA domain-containing protein [Hyphomicrobium sp. 99]|uniref:FHA domain-containing protein n=1 Tax=Hyphomicrobium sp. 99 TaxID=1163419 RepID=UPI001FD9BB97|nr:FHA domain-containing protein [Hyphomicrobium sp. 99]